MSRLRTAALLGVIALPIVIGGAAIERQSTRDGAHVFDQVLSLVSERFVDTLQQNQLFEKAARGLVQQLDDPYSELYTPAQLKRFSTIATGKYGGIGMQIEQQEGAIVVVRVFDHTPAEQAGIAEGDHIIGIDTASTRGWTSQQVSDVLVGTIGTKVKVKFARPGVATPIEHAFTRAEIHVPAVPYALMLDNKVAYVPLQQFSENSATELRANVNRLVHEGAKGIVLDLRNDPGGILDQGLDIADLFLNSGQTIASVRTRQGPPQVFTTHGGTHLTDIPLVVLVDGYSASASEIVTGALQDHDRALVVGTTSFGKGLVQTVFPLDGGWAMKLTTGKWYTPSGRSIQKNRKHIDPDSAVGAVAADDTNRTRSRPTPSRRTVRSTRATRAARSTAAAVSRQTSSFRKTRSPRPSRSSRRQSRPSSPRSVACCTPMPSSSRIMSRRTSPCSPRGATSSSSGSRRRRS